MKYTQVVSATILFSLAVLPSSAQAAKRWIRATPCSRLLLDTDGFEKKYLKEANLAFDFHAKTIKEATKVLGELEAPPFNIEITGTIVEAGRSQAQVFFEEKRLLTFLHGAASDPNTGLNLDPVTAHEYGHFVYDHNLRKKLPLFLPVRQDPYAELFSDLLAVLQSHDRTSIPKVLALTDLRADLRDFHPKKRKLPRKFGCHQLFAETRWFIGDVYLSNPNFLENPGRLTTAVFRAIIQSFREGDFAEEKRTYSARAAKKFNRDLIRRIKKRYDRGR